MASNTKRRNKPQVERRTTLDNEKKREMLAVLIRNRDAFDAVSEQLTVKQVQHWSASMAFIWDLVRKFVRSYDNLPKRGQLVTEMHNAFETSGDQLTPEELSELDEFVEYVWDDKDHGAALEDSLTHFTVAVDTCRQMLEENVLHALQRETLRDNSVPVNLPAMLMEVQDQVGQLQSLANATDQNPFPEGWDVREERQLFSTGNETLDTFMGGGWRGGEVMLFMGPYGSCKTTLTCDAVANSLYYAQELEATGNARKSSSGVIQTPVVVLMFTEGDLNEYRDRLLSNIANVPWRRLSQMRSVKDLDDGDEPGASPSTQYELKLFAADEENTHKFRSEQQRVADAVLLANRHLMLLDCTDSDESPYRLGAGGIPALATAIKMMFKRRQNAYPLAFWLDHVSGLVDRMSDTIHDEYELRRVLKNIPRTVRDMIGRPFNAPTMLLHQYSGASQARGVTAKFHHSDAEGSKEIGKYVVFSFGAGAVDENGYTKIECTKHRRERPKPVRIVRVVGKYNRIIDCTATHAVNGANRTIMKKSDMDAIAQLNNVTHGSGVSLDPVTW